MGFNKFKGLLLDVIIAAIFVHSAVAQVAIGQQPFASFGGGPFDTVDLGNLNVHFTVPVIQKAGKGVPFSYSLAYDSSVWYPVTVSGHLTWQMVPNAGWSINSQATAGYVTYTATTGSGQCARQRTHRS